MIVHLASAEKATCPVDGCACAQRTPRDPSDMTDAEWEVLAPQARAVMTELRKGPGGRPMVHRLRVVVDAIRYLVRYGVEWRALPADFPPWQAVYAFFERWAERGLPQRLVDRLRGQLRVGAGRAELPTAAVIDSQSVKAADTVGAATSGFDGGNHAGRVVMPGSLRPVGVPAALLGVRPVRDPALLQAFEEGE